MWTIIRWLFVREILILMRSRGGSVAIFLLDLWKICTELSCWLKRGRRRGEERGKRISRERGSLFSCIHLEETMTEENLEETDAWDWRDSCDNIIDDDDFPLGRFYTLHRSTWRSNSRKLC